MRNCPRILRNLFVVLIAVPFTFAGFLLQASAQPTRGGPPLPKETQIPEVGVEVEMLRYNRLPMIEAMVNGQGPYRFVVDTGAAGVVLKEKLAKKLELPTPPGMAEGMRIKVRAPGSAGLPASLFYIDSLTVGKVKIGGIWTIAMELPFGDGMDGVIGMDVFNDCLLTYDYPNDRMSFTRGELPSVNDRDVLSYSNPRMPNTHPEIELKIDGEPIRFMIDTGLRGWFAMSEKAIEGWQVIQGPASGEMGMSAAGLIPSEVSRIDNTISAGDFSVRKPIVRTISGNLAANVVGTFFLENFKVTFDAKNKRIGLAGPAEKSVTPKSLRSLGFGLKNEGDQMLVWYVHPESHASKIGIQADDLILTINGQPAREIFEGKDWQELLQSNDQLTVDYRAEDDESPKTASLNILEILPGADVKSVGNRQ